MLETIFILYIILLFIFPVPALAFFLGLVTTWEIYRKFCLCKYQPREGKKLLMLNAAASTVNFIASLAVASGLAFMVHFLIVKSAVLLAFNFIFCLGVSVRWFDYTHQIYRHLVYKMNPGLPSQPVFVLCKGFARSGWGLLPAYTDAGALVEESGKVVFHGVFSSLRLDAVARAEKNSFEKIKVSLTAPVPVVIFVIKDQFYPFKSRETRDRLLQSIENLS